MVFPILRDLFDANKAGMTKLSTVLLIFAFVWLVVQVFIAQSRSSTRHRDVEDEELTRIFVMIPKTFSEEDLKETFKVTTHTSHLVSFYNIFSFFSAFTLACLK